MSVELQSTNKTCGGELRKYAFPSKVLGGTTAKFNVFVPPIALGASDKQVPVLYFLAGLTCTEDNAAQKGGLLQTAASQGIAVVFPDTSPRGSKIEGEDDSYDFGSGAGFYVNADKTPYSKTYKMYDHVVKELPEKLQEAKLPLNLSKQAITGHSMGGCGALQIYLRESGKFTSCSAFAPIANPVEAPWGKKAFAGYFNDPARGKEHDPTQLIANAKGADLHILVDCGTGDNFYKEKQLLPENFETAARKAGYEDKDVQIRMQDGYDHSYYFISTFAPEHVNFHAKFLNA